MTAMANGGTSHVKQRRQRTMLDLIGASPIGSQEGLVKVPRGDRHVYATPENAASGNAYDARLQRLLEDIPVRVGRSGLSLVLLATPGSAGAIAQAIDQSSLTDQVGTLAGDNTLLVLFEDEASLKRWLARFQTFQPAGAETLPAELPFSITEAPR
jgi:arginine repressor